MKMGSTMWQFKYKMRRNPWQIILSLALLIAVFFTATWLIEEDAPAVDTRTVGQAVIDGWVYGGLDSAGNLIFQQGDQVVLLPKGSTEVKLNGKRAAILSSSSDTIRIDDALPEKEATNNGLFSASFWLMCGVGIGWWLGKQKASRKTYPSPPMKRWNRRRFVR